MDPAGSLRNPDRSAGAHRAETIQQEIDALSSRDWQLWSIGALLMLVLASGFLALVLPNLAWSQKNLILDHRFVPQLMFGLMTLIVLANIYLIAQRKSLNSTRGSLIRELVYSQRLENLSLYDPLTNLFNRRAMDEFVGREVTRVDRQGTQLTFLMLDVDGFRAVNANFGHQTGDEVLIDVAHMLKSNFRGADILFRYGGDEFLVVMPETSEEQAEIAVRRLLRGVENWNLTAKRGFELVLNWGITAHVAGAIIADVLRDADRKLYQRKHEMVALF
jgi:diguanylate cyclase (GGDEF)-like protein